MDTALRRRLASNTSPASDAISPQRDAAALQERWEAEMALIEERYGKDWRERHQIIETDGKEICPGIESGWMICMLCHKQLGGPGTVWSHFEGAAHMRNVQWQDEILRRAEAARAPPVAPLALLCSQDWATAVPWLCSGWDGTDGRRANPPATC